MLLLFGMLVDSKKSNEYQSAYYQQKCTEQGLNPAQKTLSSDAADEQIIASGNDSDRENEPNWCDLAAQQSVAEDATIASRTGIMGIVISAIGLTMLYLTLAETRNATTAVVRSNESFILASNAQLRPYVFINDIGCEVEPRGDLTEHDIRVFVTWKNCGQTPTVRAMWDLNFRHDTSDSLPQDFTYPQSNDRGSVVLGPGQESRDVSIVIPGSKVELARSGYGRIFLWGWVEYSDNFPNTLRHRTEMCVILEPTDDDRICLPHTCDHHNGADEECLKKPITKA
ncbi:hypothetical protein [Hoeflea sp.]|uniref:hypothetical protein n=1 Tax=Hoeflea sp. TaxID=1940281 RepID=UPI003A929FB6